MDKQQTIIGFYGNVAISSKELEKSANGKTVNELLEASQFKMAYTLAKLNNNDAELQMVATAYNQMAKSSYNKENLDTLFGVFAVDMANQKIKSI